MPHQKTFALPDRADPGGALMSFLQDAAEADVAVSLAGARRVDPRVVETLVVAARHWAGRGLGFVLTDVPPEAEARLARLGLGPDLLARSPRGATPGATPGSAA